MRLTLPALNLKAKLMALMVVILALTLGAEVIVSIDTQNAIVDATQEKVKDLARAIQISVEELTSVGAVDRDTLPSYVKGLKLHGLEVSIASTQNLVINSSNPSLIGAPVDLPDAHSLPPADGRRNGKSFNPFEEVHALELTMPQKTAVYRIPVRVENHLLGYVVLAANFADFTAPLERIRVRLLTVALGIFAIGLVMAYVLAERYVEPIHAVANAAQNIAARGLEPVPEANRRDEIGLLTHSFNQMVSQLRSVREREQELNQLERFTALGQLAGGLAHEIKNPLNFISLAIDQLRARYAPQLGADRESYQRQLQIMKDEIHRLTELIQSFLHYGNPVEIHPAPTDLHRLLDGVLAISESKIKSQDIRVAVGGNDTPAILNVDAEKLRTCFVNVVANAIQAMPDGGILSVTFARDAAQLVVRFSDSGAGIDPEVARRVFEPFFTTKREGIGLGLFLSKTIMEKHGAAIAIEANQPGPGTMVTFTFPLTGIHMQS